MHKKIEPVHPDELADAVDLHGRMFHGADAAATQLPAVRRRLDQALATAPFNRNAIPHLGSLWVLMSALSYKAGQPQAARDYALSALKHGGMHNDPAIAVHGYIRYVQNECWNGDPHRAARFAKAGMDGYWNEIVPKELKVWLASHAMRALAMTGDFSGYDRVRELGTAKLRNLGNDEMTAFSFQKGQWNQAVAIGEMYARPSNAIGWYNTAIEQNPPEAVHVTTLDKIHKAGAFFRLEFVPAGYEYLISTLRERLSYGVPLDGSYKDRTRKILTLIPEHHDHRRTVGLHEQVSRLIA